MSVLFFRAAPAAPPPAPPLPDGYRASLWRPAGAAVRPPGVPGRALVAWWAMHHLRVFANREYGQLLVHAPDGTLAHRSAVFPGWFRFPFMAPADLQIGDTWTHPDHRGRGLAAAAIGEILARAARPGRAFWYLTEAANVASVRAAEKAGLRLAGRGERTARLGVRALGAFVITGAAG